MTDWKARAEELAYALEVHLYGGHGKIADYTVQDANQFAQDALERFHDAQREDDSTPS